MDLLGTLASHASVRIRGRSIVSPSGRYPLPFRGDGFAARCLLRLSRQRVHDPVSPFLARVPWSGSPGSTVLRDTPTPGIPSRRASFSFAWRYLSPASHVRLSHPAVTLAGQARGLVVAGVPCRLVLDEEEAGPPRFLENPPMSVPCSSTPAGPRASGPFATPRYCLPPFLRRRLPRSTLSGLIPTARNTRCLRFAGRITPAPRKTRFRQRASFAGRDWLPAGFH